MNDLDYVTHTPGGRVVKSSTMPLRDDEGRVFGALCVNLDVTALRQAGDLLSAPAGAAPAHLPTTTFTLDERAVFAVRNAVPRVAARLGVSRSAVYTDLAQCRGAVTEEPESEEP